MNLVLRYLKVLNPQFSPAGQFLVEIPKILVELCEQTFLCDFNLFIGKNDATALPV